MSRKLLTRQILPNPGSNRVYEPAQRKSPYNMWVFSVGEGMLELGEGKLQNASTHFQNGET